jgi:hypothetical protein
LFDRDIADLSIHKVMELRSRDVSHEQMRKFEGYIAEIFAAVTGLSHAGQVSYALTAAFAREGAHLAISARGAKRVHARAKDQQENVCEKVCLLSALNSRSAAKSVSKKGEKYDEERDQHVIQ